MADEQPTPRPTKRQADANGNPLGTATPPPPGFVQVGEARAILAEGLHSQAASIQRAMETFSATMATENQRVQEETNQKFDALGTEVASLKEFRGRQEETNEKVSKDLEALKAQANDLQVQLRVANQNAVSREDMENDKFDRPPNLSILRINCPKYVTKRAVHDVLAPWMAEVDIAPEQFVLVGDEPQGRYFVVKFLVNSFTAAKFVEDAYGNLKDSSGKYRVFKAKLANNEQTLLHIHKDESDKDRTKRRMAACLKKALQALYPDRPEPKYRYYKGTIVSGDVGVCFLAPTSKDVEWKYFLWNPDLSQSGLDKANLLAKTMEYLTRPEEEIQWCL